MVIRSKNPTPPQGQTQVRVSTQTTGPGKALHSPKVKKIRVLDVNEIHKQEAATLDGLSSENSITRPGQKFLAESLNSLENELSAQKQEAATLLEALRIDDANLEKKHQLHDLQSQMAVNQKKIQLLKRKDKWIRAGILEIQSSRVPQKYAEEAARIDQMPDGPERQEAQLSNLLNALQQMRKDKSGMRLSVAEAGAMNRHQLGAWAPELLPEKVLADSVVSILTQSPCTNDTVNQVHQWLNQGFGGANLKRLHFLAKVSAFGQE